MFEEILKMIEEVKINSKCEEIILLGNKKVFNELIKSGFPLHQFRHKELSFFPEDLKNIYIIPDYDHKPIKIVMEGFHDTTN